MKGVTVIKKWSRVLTMQVLRVTNMNFLLTIPRHHQKKRLGELTKTMNKGEMLQYFIKFSRLIIDTGVENLYLDIGLEGLDMLAKVKVLRPQRYSSPKLPIPKIFFFFFFFCNNWSRDQLSVNTKIVRFWKSLLAGAERAYQILVTSKFSVVHFKVAIATAAEN